MEHIRLLCGDELKDKARGVSDACQRLFSQRNGSMWQKKDATILNSYADGLSSIAEELLDLEQTLIPAMKSCQSAASEDFVPFEQRLAALSRRFDELAPVMQQFLHSTAPGCGGQTVAARLRKSAATVETPYVQTALENLEKLILRCWNQMEEQTAARMESDYLQTLELTLWELGQTERAAQFLGHPHTLTGAVRHGRGVGSSRLFPTANLAVPPHVLVPSYGVYVTRACLPDGTNYAAVTNVGIRPTLDNGADVTVEACLLDFNGDLYGQTLRLEFYQHLRHEMRFDSLDSLRARIAADAETTRRYFEENPV